jgi:hypothetical protein
MMSQQSGVQQLRSWQSHSSIQSLSELFVLSVFEIVCDFLSGKSIDPMHL